MPFKNYLFLFFDILISCKNESLNSDFRNSKIEDSLNNNEFKKPYVEIKNQISKKLIHLLIAGDYPNWLDYDSVIKYKIKESDYLNTKCQHYTYWVEPINKDIYKVDLKNNSIVEFVGLFDSVKRVPVKIHFISPTQPKWIVFMYSDFKI